MVYTKWCRGVAPCTGACTRRALACVWHLLSESHPSTSAGANVRAIWKRVRALSVPSMAQAREKKAKLRMRRWLTEAIYHPSFCAACEDNGGCTRRGPGELESTWDFITFIFFLPLLALSRLAKMEKKEKEISATGRGCDFRLSRRRWKAFLRVSVSSLVGSH